MLFRSYHICCVNCCCLLLPFFCCQHSYHLFSIDTVYILISNKSLVVFCISFYTVLTGYCSNQVQKKREYRLCGIVLNVIQKTMISMISVLNVADLNPNHQPTIAATLIATPTIRYSLIPSKSIVDIAELQPHTRKQLTIIFNCLLSIMPVPFLWHWLIHIHNCHNNFHQNFQVRSPHIMLFHSENK